MNLHVSEESKDIVISAGQLLLVSGAEEYQQHLAQRLRTFLGEWFLDKDLGLPYYDAILIKRPNPQVIDSLFINEIVNTPGIINLLSFATDLDPNLRALSVEFIAETTEGLVEFNSEVP